MALAAHGESRADAFLLLLRRPHRETWSESDETVMHCEGVTWLSCFAHVASASTTSFRVPSSSLSLPFSPVSGTNEHEKNFGLDDCVGDTQIDIKCLMCKITFVKRLLCHYDCQTLRSASANECDGGTIQKKNSKRGSCSRAPSIHFIARGLGWCGILLSSSLLRR